MIDNTYLGELDSKLDAHGNIEIVPCGSVMLKGFFAKATSLITDTAFLLNVVVRLRLEDGMLKGEYKGMNEDVSFFESQITSLFSESYVSLGSADSD